MIGSSPFGAAAFGSGLSDGNGAAVLCPALTVEATGSVPAISANASITCPTPRAFFGVIALATANIIAPMVAAIAYGGASAAVAAPSMTAAIRAHDSYGEQAAFVSSPSVLVSGFGGANAGASLPKPTLVSSGTVTRLASVSITSPRAVIASSGTTTATARANIVFGYRLSAFLMSAYGGAVSKAVTGFAEVAATGTGGGISSFLAVMPSARVEAAGTQQRYARAAVVMPSVRLGAVIQAWITSPSFQVIAIGTRTTAPTYEAYALNLKHNAEVLDELTHFTNYPFDKIIRYQNSYFGVNSTGLYLLEGATDDTAPIPYSVKTKLTDFGTDQKKTPEAAVFGGRLGPDATVTVYTGETEDDVYAYTTPRGQDVQNYRQKFGKGLKARYYAFGIQGDGAMSIDTVSFDLATLKRRI